MVGGGITNQGCLGEEFGLMTDCVGKFCEPLLTGLYDMPLAFGLLQLA